MSFRVLDIDPNNSPKKILDKYVDFFDKLQKEQSPKDPLTPRDIQLKRIKAERAGEVRVRKALFFEKRNIIVANLYMLYFTEESHEFEKNKHILYMNLNVLREFKKSEVEKELLFEALEITKQNKLITIIESCTTFQRGWEFLEKIGAEFTLEEGVNRLYLDETDWDSMKEWVEEGRKRGQEEEIELISFKECPDEIIEDFTALYTELMKLVPFGESAWSPSVETPQTWRKSEEKRKERGFDWWNMVTKEKDGKLSGLTEIIFSPDSPHRVAQELTGVEPGFRGRGLGKWLKAEMLFYIKENLPKSIYIQTGNADFNAPMMSINNRMGFKRHQTEKCYKIKIEELEKNLKQL
ncbi:MAG: GNAT family N-acetyltransferase [Candidatus Heimdallarchaeota archaeon]|nr:GNAT family N-acetyltransferase [Candidatus Heimdallarchaeota archaeon]MCK4877845.1 GNAT family N-acetyltransferase [Candidatus Heimdallarchaeota archaeon]